MNTTTLAADHAACAALLRESASNFALPIRLLPEAKRRGTTALYAFCRRADDIVDDEPDRETARRGLAAFASRLDAAFVGEPCEDPVVRAVIDTVRRFAIPIRYLHDILTGVEMDLDRQTYDTFEHLKTYCRRVASAVGLAAIHIWGFRSEKALEPADACGLAFQLTNILRDIPEDLGRGRIYLPAEDFAACGCTVGDLENGRIGAGFADLAAVEVARAESYFAQARDLDALLSTDGRMVFRAMFGVYRGLLDGVRRAGPAIFTTKVRPSKLIVVGTGLATLALGTRPWKGWR
jgi:phytoene synthase